MKKLKWTHLGEEGYETTASEFRSMGAKRLREIPDYECESIFTFWMVYSPVGQCIIQQTWVDTGDVLIWRLANSLEEAVQKK